MENKRRIFRIVTALIALAVVAAMCVLLVACDPEGKEGGETAAGGGDAIFTEDATLAGILEKLAAAESFTFEQRHTSVSEEYGEVEEIYTYNISPQAWWLEMDLGGDGVTGECSYFSDGWFYRIFWYGAYGDHPVEIGTCYKYSTQYGNETLSEGRLDLCEDLSEYLTEKDGRIVFDEERMISESDDYVAGSGYVKLNGTSIEVGCSYGTPGNADTVKYIISAVNATTVTIPDYIKAAEKDAVLSEW